MYESLGNVVLCHTECVICLPFELLWSIRPIQLTKTRSRIQKPNRKQTLALYNLPFLSTTIVVLHDRWHKNPSWTWWIYSLCPKWTITHTIDRTRRPNNENCCRWRTLAITNIMHICLLVCVWEIFHWIRSNCRSSVVSMRSIYYVVLGWSNPNNHQ